MSQKLSSRNIVLLGAGHTHAHVLHMWRSRPISDTHLICVSNFSSATYSGMLPGVLAGQYDPSEMQIDLVRFCRAVGATLIVAEPTGLDLIERLLLFADRPPLPFDMLSVGIGSRPSFDGLERTDAADDRILAIKPMQTFLRRLDQQLVSAASALSHAALKIAIVGAGAGGCEIAMCLPPHLHRLLPACAHEITLIHAHAVILPELRASTRRRVTRVLANRAVQRITQDRVTVVDEHGLQLSSGRRVPADVVIWATGAVGPPLLAQLGLPLDERGFLLTRRTLQTVADVPVFAVGDSGTMHDHRTAKAGVYAVRQGPVLWHNLRSLAEGTPLREYRPQSGFLKLLNSGDGKAIGEYGRWSFSGRCVWKWKDHIDRAFMAKFQNDRPAATNRISG